MEQVEISGEEVAKMIFGGTVMSYHMKGDPNPQVPGNYEHLGFTAWSPKDGCYRDLFVNSMGEAEVSRAWAIGDRKIVMTSATTKRNQPLVVRHVLELDDQGAMKSIYSDAIVADGEPTRVLEGEYEKKER
jgi:hypothetical protein